ncbi:unnamed protein product [Didymodactylos carnosus]|uniref:RCC1-like domain-containing protein n=1 Tax=Didymodactylos carnosus TaxID=1234261 RepID=A0A8S2UWK2_9BILA|nr:unnamed protein product [Didymodactylos carnosus]CAF4341265.1 unnamed protein product [Didymodactylos carnosus]
MVDEDNAPQVYLLGKTSLVASSRNQFYIRNDPVLQIACGDQHTIIVTQSGRAFAFGDNSSGQLGLGHNDKVDKVSCIKSLKFNDDREKVCLAACGREHSIVTTTKGSLYSFGSNSIDQLGIDTNKYKGESTESKSSLYSKPTKLDSLPANIMWKRLAAGAEHSCALTKQGTVYVWGSNSDGQCGFPKQQETIKLPKELKLQYRVKEIACGYYHTALVSDDGSLYTFGNNSDQQLGRSSSEKQTGPIHVPLPNPVKSVACGNQHTAVLTDNGHILVVGNGERGQLGLGRSLSSTERFEPVNEFKGKKVIAIDCGESHTAAIVGKGDLYTFGDGSHGKLGVKDGKVESEFLPRLVDKFRHLTVLNVSCGGCHTILLAQEKSTSNKNASDSDDDIKGMCKK